MAKSKANLKESKAIYKKEARSINEMIFLIKEDPEGGYNAQALGYSILLKRIFWSMPKVPRDVSHKDLCKALGKYGYIISRQTGSHIRC